jgi:tetrahydromethanopterin S-methyltransferase subunit G
MGWFDGVRKLRDGIRIIRDPKALVDSDLGKAAKQHVDEYVWQKMEEARTVAGGLAEETLQRVKSEATLFLDVIEARIDAKLAEIEQKLEVRLQRELYWKLIGLRWTLLFVVLMAVVSLVYVILRRKFGAG